MGVRNSFDYYASRGYAGDTKISLVEGKRSSETIRYLKAFDDLKDPLSQFSVVPCQIDTFQNSDLAKKEGRPLVGRISSDGAFSLNYAPNLNIYPNENGCEVTLEPVDRNHENKQAVQCRQLIEVSESLPPWSTLNRINIDGLRILLAGVAMPPSILILQTDFKDKIKTIYTSVISGLTEPKLTNRFDHGYAEVNPYLVTTTFCDGAPIYATVERTY